MCFVPEGRTLFRHVNFQKWSERGVFSTFWPGHVLSTFSTFWLGNVLRATTACNFSSLIWLHNSAPAALASLLFDPPEPQIIGKKPWIATLLPFRAPASSFFSLFLFSDLLSSALLLFDSSHLCFSICPYCRKFDFETSFDFPYTSNIYIHIFTYIYSNIYIYIYTSIPVYIYIYIYIIYIYIYVCVCLCVYNINATSPLRGAGRWRPGASHGDALCGGRRIDCPTQWFT